VTYELVASLTAAGFVLLQGSYDRARARDAYRGGQAIVLQLVAVAKATESHAERNLGSGRRNNSRKRCAASSARRTRGGQHYLLRPS